jgi:class 3 adenylate cyclase
LDGGEVGRVPEGRSASVARGFLFADLRNYSRWVEAHGDHAAAELLRAYRTVVRAAVAEFDGAEIRTEGDSFYVAFGSPSAAVMCGLRILGLARESTTAGAETIPVGIGVHAGETVETEEGYVGSAVNIAARICSQAAAGELLVSDSVRSLTRTYLDVVYVARGRRRLKGIDESIGLFRVEPSGSAVTSRSQRGRDLGGGRSRIAGAALMVTVALAAALLGGALVREGLGAPTTPPAASGPPTVSAESPTQSALVAEPGPGEFPNPAEARLLARLDDATARHCQRADVEDVPQLEEEASVVIPLAHDAGLECRLGSVSEPDTVWYWSAVLGQRSEQVSNIFFQTAGRRSLPPGDCATDDLAYGRWEFGANRGHLLCYGMRTATLMWTYDDHNVLATAIRSGGTVRTLYTWWRAHARLLGS